MKIKKIVFDIDGVCRNLIGCLCQKYNLFYPIEWNDWGKEGIDIYELVKRDYNVLIKSKPTIFVEAVKRFADKTSTIDKPIEFWSNQPEDWIKYTTKWLNKHFSYYKLISLTPEEKFKRLKKEKDTILIDDYPLFENNDRIITYGLPYNIHLLAAHWWRINLPETEFEYLNEKQKYNALKELSDFTLRLINIVQGKEEIYIREKDTEKWAIYNERTNFTNTQDLIYPEMTWNTDFHPTINLDTLDNWTTSP